MPSVTVRDIAIALNAEFQTRRADTRKSVQSACASDLMSDVLAFGKPGILLLTGLSNAQSVRTANIIDAKAIMYVRGKKPDETGIEFAKEKGIPLLSTKLMMYTACGLLYGHGLQGVSKSPHQK